MIRFLLDGDVIEVETPDPTATVLDYLRYTLRRTGTKEGCAEGDCGACTVLLGELRTPLSSPAFAGEGDQAKPGGGDLGSGRTPPPRDARSPSPGNEQVNRAPHGSAMSGGHGDLFMGEDSSTRGDSVLRDAVAWRAVNACILFLPMLDGKALRTVESLGGTHPVQREMVERHGSQCGFCTPGFVMSLYGRSLGAVGTVGVPVGDVIAGNLCRCTGYGPILDAGEAVPMAVEPDEAIVAALRALRPAYGHPASADALADLLLAHPETRIVAGATDVGLWVTKQLRDLGPTVFIGDIADLRQIEESPDALILGAAVRYSDAREALARLHPDLGELVRRIGGVQVRNAGTIGGNIANGSPIGDMPPAFIALGAELTLRRGTERRTMPLEDFFLDYGKQDRAPGEFVESVRIPRPSPDMLVRIVKLSKRFDSDISGVCGAFALRIADGIVTQARIAFGGMAPIPARASGCEAALTGQAWTEAVVEAAAQALAEEYEPLDDLRGSAAYRRKAAANLLRRLLAEASEPVSVLDG